MHLTMEKLHTRMVQFSSNKFGNIVPIQAIPGHFVTSHSHVNYFIDLTMLKSSQEDAQKCAHALASQYKDIDSIDTIICLDGTGIIGAFLSVELQKKDTRFRAQKDLRHLSGMCKQWANVLSRKCRTHGVREKRHTPHGYRDDRHQHSPRHGMH